MKLILSTICVMLLALFAYQVMSYPTNFDEENYLNTPGDELTQSIERYDLPKLTVLKEIKQYSEIVARPLFEKDRKGSIQNRTTKKVATVNELSHLILVGTARSTEVQVGIIADTKAKQMERLKVGENYKDWKIAEVAPDHVTFQNANLEHKLYVTPIKGSQKDKQARLISQLNKSKIERATAAINSYQELTDDEAEINTKQDRSVSGRSWGYNKKYKGASKDTSDENGSKQNSNNKTASRSPIKIPDADEKDSEFYEGFGDDDALEQEVLGILEREISAEDFYNDEEISEDELRALEALGAKIFDD